MSDNLKSAMDDIIAHNNNNLKKQSGRPEMETENEKNNPPFAFDEDTLEALISGVEAVLSAFSNETEREKEDLMLGFERTPEPYIKDFALCQKQHKKLKELVDKLRAEVNKSYDAVRKNYLPTLLENVNVNNITFDEIGRLTIQGDAYVSVKSGKQEEAIEWLNEHGLGGIVCERINAVSLKSNLKKKVAKGETLPDEIFNFAPYSFTKITALTKNKKQEV